MLEFMQGDLFETPADIRVNTVNCVGVMGAGVALAFKQRYPQMYKDYQRDCKDGRVRPGKMHIWRSLSGDWIVNFPTKRDWREPSRYEDISTGLDDLRDYLETVGPVTVALPALGCGHGGLDWTRVSEMIRKKLNGVDAHVLVFEPFASRHAGRTAVEIPTDDEIRGAANLGYHLVEREQPLTTELPTPLYVLGNQEALFHKWIALLPSRTPTDREIHALGSVAAQLARSGNVTVALVHGTRASEQIAQLFVSQGISTILLLPFGVLTRKSIAKQLTVNSLRPLTIASISPANAKWSPQLLAKTMEILRVNATAMLLSDPEPDWLIRKGLGKWAQIPISYIRYETTALSVRDALFEIGATPISRRSDNGAPNVNHLVDSLAHRENVVVFSDETTTLPPAFAKYTSNMRTHSIGLAGGSTYAIDLSRLSHKTKRNVFEVLARIEARQLDVKVKLPANVSDGDIVQLEELGFRRQEQD